MRLQRVLATAAILAVCGAGPLQAKKWDAVTQFSDANPSGQWSYGSGTTGTTFSPYTVYDPAEAGDPTLQFWGIGDIHQLFLGVNSGTTHVGLATGSNLLQTGVLLMHPGTTTDSILQWTTKKPGIYKFTGSYELLNSSATGIAAKIFTGSAQTGSTDITSLAFGGGTGVLTGPPANVNTLQPGGQEAFSFKLNLLRGDIVWFGLNANGNYSNDLTGVSVQVKKVKN